MTKRMLIDATHRRERRVALLNNDRITDFEFETAYKQSTKGNIYLAKVVRIEPSLQAAFVEYGSDRHGFLAFSDIHFNYYQIPVADREALENEKQKLLDAQTEEAEEGIALVDDEGDGEGLVPGVDDIEIPDAYGDQEDTESNGDFEIETAGGIPEDVENTDAPVAPRFNFKEFYHRYKIQEVIKRGQVILIQVVKDERGNKGAAVTTYVSLPGRYCVLMPNAFHKGGVSRKISDVKDRRRIRKILESLGVPDNMSLIVRTAGKDRNKLELKRDCDYLLRLWEDIREKALDSMAPSMVYEEANVVRQSMRDLYHKDIDEVLVEGKDAYADAKLYIKQLMPSHSKKVKLYKEETPLFQEYEVDAQLEELYKSQVVLPSGGYLVINQTEALVSIDINSGRATRERNISETAYKTNLEATAEIARQLRLRNLAGLIVIDFIDMDYGKHISAVERKLREVMREDRARVQIGSISQFGLLELSRQRLGVSYHETITQLCPQCQGHGMIPANHMLALKSLRHAQQLASKISASRVSIRMHPDLMVTILNEFRHELSHIEQRLQKTLAIEMDSRLRLDEVALSNQKPVSLEAVTQGPQKNKKLSELRTKNNPGKKPQKETKNIVEGAVVIQDLPASEESASTGDADRPVKRKRNRNRRRRNRNRDIQAQAQSGGSPTSDASTSMGAEIVSLAAPQGSSEDQILGNEVLTKSRKKWWKKIVQ